VLVCEFGTESSFIDTFLALNFFRLYLVLLFHHLHCISFDMIDISKIPTVTGSKIPTVTGLRYCNVIVERETRFAHIQLHATEDEIVQVFKRVLPILTKKPLMIKSDCASHARAAVVLH